MARLGSLRFFVGLCLFLLGTTTPVSAGSGCGMDILGICNAAKTLAPVIDSLPAHLRDAANAVADNLFNNLLPPAIDKFTAAAEKLEDRAEIDFEKAVNATSRAVYDLAQKALMLTEHLAANVTKDIEEVVQEVQKAISSDLDKFFSDVDKTVNNLLTDLEGGFKTLFCGLDNWADSFQQSLATHFQGQDCECVQQMLASDPGVMQDCSCSSCFHIGGLYPRCTCKPLGFEFSSIYAKSKYEFLKCHLKKPIDWDKWTVGQIVSQLAILQKAALGYRCWEDLTSPGSTFVRDYFSDEYTNVTYTIDQWLNNFTSAPSSTAPTPSPTAPTPAPTAPTPAPTAPTLAPTSPTAAPTQPTPAPTCQYDQLTSGPHSCQDIGQVTIKQPAETSGSYSCREVIIQSQDIIQPTGPICRTSNQLTCSDGSLPLKWGGDCYAGRISLPAGVCADGIHPGSWDGCDGQKVFTKCGPVADWDFWEMQGGNRVCMWNFYKDTNPGN